MDAFRREAAILRHQARQLMARADEIDPPVAPVKAAPAPRLLCPDCGTEYGGPEYRHGDPCLTERCCGLIVRKGSRDEMLHTTDGRSLGVTLGRLAFEQAWRDMGELPGLDIASSYGGRAS